MRGSEPMPWRTCSMSAPSRSARFASSFMKQILVASIALAAYLVSSAERTSITMHALVVAVERRVERRAAAPRSRALVGADDDAVGPHEVVDRRAFLEELGVRDDVERDVGAARGERLRRSRARTLSAVPTGTVDLSTTTLRLVHVRGRSLRAAASTYCRSAEPSSSGGVPTAMNWTRPCATPRPRRW